MDPLSVSASIVSLVALANDVSRMTLKILEMNKIAIEGNSAFIREVTRLMSVMDACTHCHCRCWISRNNALQFLISSNPKT